MFQSSDETVLNISSLKPVENESILIDQIYTKEYKPFNVIQYWVNTGYLPYKKLYIDKDTQSDIELSHSNELCLSSSHKSSSSSVDTAKYILSNMNTTNKIETMAIIEGAKHNAIETFQDIENTEKLQITANNMHEKNNEHTENNNGNDQQYCTLNETHKVLNHVLQQSIDIEKNISQLQKNIDVNNDDTFLNDTHDKLINNNSNKNSYIEQNLSNMTNNLDLQNSIIKGHRKKLYTGRNSPVDLINMRSNNKNTIFQSKQNLHPALDFECTLSKRYKIWKKRKSQFSIYNKYLMNNTQFNTLSHKKQRKRSKLRKTSIKNNETVYINNNTIQKNSKIKQQSMKCNIDQNINRLQSINDLTNIKNKFNELINYEEKINVEQCKETNDITKKIKNLNPIIYLTRLSKDDIEKYKGSGKTKENINNSIELSINNQKHKKLNEMIKLKNLTVCLTRLSKLDIEKYKKSKNVLPKIINSNLNVCLEQLSEIEIQKYKNINNKELSKNDLLSKSIQSCNDDINIHKFFQHNTLNCIYSNDSGTNSYSNINLITEDTNSDQSTVLICKCSNTSFDLSSSLSLSSENSSQFDFSKTFDNYILKSKKRYNEKERKNNKVFSRKINTTEKSVKNKIGRISDKNQPNHIADKNKYNIKNKELSNINDSCKKSSNINENIFLNKNVYQNINSITLSSNKSEISSESSSIYTSNNKKKRPRVVSSDEEDFVHCLKDTQKLKLKHYKMLNQNLNNMNKKTKKNIIKYSNLNTSLNESELLTNNIRFKTQEEDVSSIKRQKSLQQYNLSMEKDCNQSTIKAQTVIKDQIKKLSKVNTSQIAKKSHVSHLLFKTKIFSSDSDSEYLTE